MSTPKRTAAPIPVTAGNLGKLLSAGDSLRKAARRRNPRRWAIALLAVVAAIVVLWLLFLVVVRLATQAMWFDSVRAGSVYWTTLDAKILLFCVFAVVGGLVCGFTTISLRRLRPRLDASADNDTFRWLFRKHESRFGRLVVVLAVVVPAILVGQRAATGWQTYLLWRHATPWHSTDSQFHRDISFFVEINPFHVMVVSLLRQALAYAFWIAVVGGYWYGGWRLRRGKQKIARGYVVLMSALLAGYLALRAVSFWLSRYSVVTSSRGPVTGPSYTDVHAVVPGATVLTIVTGLAAVALAINAVLASGLGRPPAANASRTRVLGRSRTPVAILVVTAVVAALVGSAWPALLFHFREAPSAARLDVDEIAGNQRATLTAFGLDGDVTTVAYKGPTTTSATELQQLASSTAQPSVLDPNQLTPTFNVEQQLQAYYGFKSTLDIGTYDIAGAATDVALAVRELRLGAIPHSTWVNNHLVYTHGYGIVAAPTTAVNPKTQSPVYLDGGLPPSQEIPVTRPQVYFSPAFGSSSYSIVGRPANGHGNVEFDHPGTDDSPRSAYTTYRGGSGISIGSTLRRLLFAVQLGDPNILFSSELNDASQLLTVRDPRARVAKIAPWLTLDGDEYPAVVDGKIVWIVDGYTSSSSYPGAQLVNLRSASNTTLVANGASVAQPSSQVNYLHNSVKAVVDAYTGKVRLYAWNQKQHPDPLLSAWRAVFPGLVRPQSDIPTALLAQLRYPTDLFNVQRSLLARYHVTEPADFYSGNGFWKVPSDPTVAASQSINAAAQGGSNAPLASRYMSISADGNSAQRYSLSSPMVTLNGQQLAAFISVNAQPGPDYGKFTVLNFPSNSGGESPAQVQNDIESDTDITDALTLQRGGNSKVVLGTLEAIPVAGRILYVEPVYTRSSGSGSFPILRHVIALYGNGDPSFANTLSEAIRDAVNSTTAAG